MITLYREGLPRVSIAAAHIESREGMLVGLIHEGPELAGLLMLGDGTLTRAGLNDFRVQFHYEPETDDWVDENKPEPGQE
jgi:hypothetical protein